MMAADQFESQIRGWLASEAPVEAPDYLLDAVAARIDELGPRRGDAHGLRTLLPAVIVVLAVIVALGLGNVLNIGNPSPTGPSVAPSVTVVDCQPSPCRVPLAGQARYRTEIFAVPMTFRTVDGLWVMTDDTRELVRMERADDPRQRLTVLIQPELIPSGGHTAQPGANVEGLVAWVRTHPDLTVTDRGGVVIGGLDAVRLDIASRFDTERGDGCTGVRGCVLLLATSGEPLAVGYGDITQMYVLELDGKALVVAIEAAGDSAIDGFVPEAVAVLASLQFQPGAETDEESAP